MFMRILQAGVLYFALVFGVGFVLGPIRLFWIVPRVGTRVAELMESVWFLCGRHQNHTDGCTCAVQVR